MLYSESLSQHDNSAGAAAPKRSTRSSSGECWLSHILQLYSVVTRWEMFSERIHYHNLFLSIRLQLDAYSNVNFLGLSTLVSSVYANTSGCKRCNFLCWCDWSGCADTNKESCAPRREVFAVLAAESTLFSWCVAFSSSCDVLCADGKADHI